ncbi:MAG TPA: FAD-binding oxidoreductase [Gemmatimonadales bacterium]|nr:FAD-binding oxidoreductase [Gemmatimonadales bacterium]
MIFARLRALLGPSSVDRDPENLPRATPESAEALALVCRLAHDEQWRIRIEGRATWLQGDAPADLVVSTRALDAVLSVSPADLVATVQAGATVESVRRQLAEHAMWLAVDPPGRLERSLGSVVATGTAGTVRQGFGPVRDHVLGCTVVTGDGRIVRAGGRVVKNVAGFDLTKLHVGGFGAFGIITELHLRLRAVPEADVTLCRRGARDPLTAAARDLAEARFTPIAAELASPALAAEGEWVLGVRFAGLHAAVRAETGRLTSTVPGPWEQLEPDRAAAFWGLLGRGATSGPVTFRLGVLGEGVDETIDLIAAELGEGLLAAGPVGGGLRWTGDAPAERLRSLRRTLAAREIPLTLERAPWGVRRAVGHFGAYREGVGHLVDRLRATFDPGQRLSVALEGRET